MSRKNNKTTAHAFFIVSVYLDQLYQRYQSLERKHLSCIMTPFFQKAVNIISLKDHNEQKQLSNYNIRTVQTIFLPFYWGSKCLSHRVVDSTTVTASVSSSRHLSYQSKTLIPCLLTKCKTLFTLLYMLQMSRPLMPLKTP